MPDLIAIKPAPGFKPARGDKPAEGRTYVLVRGAPGGVRRVLERPTVVEKTAEVLRALRRGDIAKSTAAEVAEAQAAVTKAGEAEAKKARKAADEARKANDTARSAAESATKEAAEEQRALASLAEGAPAAAMPEATATGKGAGDSR